MEILFLLMPVALIVLVVAIKFLFWAISNGQYDDLDTEGQRILFDEDNVEVRPQTTVKEKQELSPQAGTDETNGD